MRRGAQRRPGTFGRASGRIELPARPASSRAPVLLAGLGLTALAAACVPLRGGWDSGALLRASPEVAALGGQRLGDMVPFPALALRGDASEALRVGLVACRFASGTALRVRAGGPGWSEQAGGGALATFGEQLAAFGLSLARTAQAPAEIEIRAVEGEEADAPEGLGDTLVECDVGDDGGAEALGAPRGVLLRAEIRMRRSGLDAAGRTRRASDEEWTGALLHELGHAAGFSGHAATGPTLLVKDESRLRDFGRAALRGEPVADPTLSALYRLRPGEPLGERPLAPVSVEWVRAIGAIDARREAEGNPRTGTVASVGDREARISLRYADGSRLGLRFPDWAEQLRERNDVVALPDWETFEAIRAGERTRSTDGDARTLSR